MAVTELQVITSDSVSDCRLYCKVIMSNTFYIQEAFATTSRLTPIQQMSLAVLSRAACALMSTTTTTTRDRGDRYGRMEWAQLLLSLG